MGVKRSRLGRGIRYGYRGNRTENGYPFIYSVLVAGVTPPRRELFCIFNILAKGAHQLET